MRGESGESEQVGESGRGSGREWERVSGESEWVGEWGERVSGGEWERVSGESE